MEGSFSWRASAWADDREKGAKNQGGGWQSAPERSSGEEIVPCFTMSENYLSRKVAPLKTYLLTYFQKMP